MPKHKVSAEVSARHVHLCKNHLEILFGKNYELTKLQDISQPGQFAANETVVLKSEAREIGNVRVLGPLREITQVEIAMSDVFFLKLKNVPVRISWDIDNTGSLTIVGPKGTIDLNKGVIVAQRHLHCSDSDAARLGLTHLQIVKIEINSKERKTVYDDVVVRVSKDYVTMLHVDTDEGNASGLWDGHVDCNIII